MTKDAQTYALEVQDYAFSYGKTGVRVLDGVTFRLEQGSFAALCGVSGSGKSTLLRAFKPELAVAGEVSGTIRVLGDDPYALDAVESATRVGFVMQDPENQLVTDTVWHELAFGLENIGMDVETMHRRVAETAHFFGIGGWFDRRTTDLSGGQKQLLNLAAIVVMQPAVLVLDEPTSQLDPIAAKDFFDVLERVNAELGITIIIIIIEHRLEDVLPMVDRVLFLEKGGRLTYDGGPDGFVRMLVESGDGFDVALPAATRMGLQLMRSGRFGGAGFEQGARGEAAESALADIAPADALADATSASAAEPIRYPVTVREGREFLANAVEQAKGEIAPHPLGRTVPPDDPVILAKDLWFRYSKDMPFVLRGVDFDVHAGRIAALVGGNGSGKSTLLSALSGVRKPECGRIANPRKLHVALMAQNPKMLFVRDRLIDDMLEWRDLGGYTESDVAAMLERFDLTGMETRHPYDLSGGETQKAALAKILLLNPDVLLLDEPVKGIDAMAKQQIGRILTDLACNEGKAILFTAHDLEFVSEVAHTCSMMFGCEISCTQDAHGFFVGNLFYSTATARIARGILDGCVTTADMAASFGATRIHSDGPVGPGPGDPPLSDGPVGPDPVAPFEEETD